MAKRKKQIPQEHRDKVENRSDGMCERCLVMRATQVHHRRYLSRGGDHNIANLIHLCGLGNSDGCHGEAHTGTGAEMGTSISRWERLHESEVPFTDLLGQSWLLDDHGGKERV